MNQSGSRRAGDDSGKVMETISAPHGAKKRNGADLAVDPTLAGSWAPRGTWRPGVSMPVSEKLLRALTVGFVIARRSRRRRFRRGPKSIARIDFLPPGGSETFSSTWA